MKARRGSREETSRLERAATRPPRATNSSITATTTCNMTQGLERFTQISLHCIRYIESAIAKEISQRNEDFCNIQKVHWWFLCFFHFLWHALEAHIKITTQLLTPLICIAESCPRHLSPCDISSLGESILLHLESKYKPWDPKCSKLKTVLLYTERIGEIGHAAPDSLFWAEPKHSHLPVPSSGTQHFNPQHVRYYSNF
jgi:hypothetical protein